MTGEPEYRVRCALHGKNIAHHSHARRARSKDDALATVTLLDDLDYETLDHSPCAPWRIEERIVTPWGPLGCAACAAATASEGPSP